MEVDRPRHGKGVALDVDMLLHDLQGLLGTTRWLLESVSREVQSRPSTLALCVSSIDEAIDSVAELSRRCQDRDAPRSRRAEKHDLRAWFLAQCERERHETRGLGAKLRTLLRIRDWHAYLDIRQLDRVVRNLCANARAVSQPGDTIVLGLEQPSRDAYRLFVEDEGPGVPEAERDAIFEPYFTRRTRGGTGLGLFICSKAAEALGGRMHLHAKPAGGSRFELTIPLRREPDDHRPRSPRVTPRVER